MINANTFKEIKIPKSSYIPRSLGRGSSETAAKIQLSFVYGEEDLVGIKKNLTSVLRSRNAASFKISKSLSIENYLYTKCFRRCYLFPLMLYSSPNSYNGKLVDYTFEKLAPFPDFDSQAGNFVRFENVNRLVLDATTYGIHILYGLHVLHFP